MWWNPAEFDKKRAYLEKRLTIIKTIRHFFDGADFTEVETPILQVCPVIDAHIRAFGTDLRGVDGMVKGQMYLHTSPEFAMKKLLVAGMERIYQICHVFRNAEDSRRHSPEFTMIEWYRTAADYNDIMRDCVGLLRAVAARAGIRHFKYKDMLCDPYDDFELLTVRGAFQRYAGFDIADYIDNTDSFREKVSGLGIRLAADDQWDDLFFRVMDARIEPHLGINTPTFLCDYPVALASLSKRKKDDPRFAERFELYVCGVELANAFSELTDATEQRRRYHEEMKIKQRLYGETYPLDEDFMAALEYGLPESGGIALGVDRLVMLVCGADHIEDVLWCPRPDVAGPVQN